MRRITNYIKKGSRLRDLGLSLLNAIAILLVCYITDNRSLSVLNGPSTGQRIEQFREYTGLAKEPETDRYFFVNIAYDKELVPVYDEYGFPKGEIDVINRERLNRFLCQLNNSHKYVIFDVLLSKEFQSPNDSALIETILDTDRIVVAHSEKATLPDNRLLEKSGYTDYSTSILETNFVKYEFLKNDSNTIASKAFRDLTNGVQVKKSGPFYFKNGHLQWKALTLRFPIKLWDSSSDKRKKTEYSFNEDKIYNLGSEILDLEMDVPELVKDKIVVIGDFTEDDIHDTYMGKIAGPVINVNALEALLNNELEIPWWLIGTLFCLYTLITYLLLRNIHIFNILQRLKLDKPFIRTLISFIGFSAFFCLVGGIIYISSGNDINVLIPAVWFTSLRWVINTLWKRKST